MGKLLYGSPSMEIDFDDRALVHLQIVISAKLRRRESFVFSWRDAPDVGDGRSSIWLDPSIPLYFRYFGSRVPAINKDWLDLLTDSANSAGGLHYCDEPGGAVAPLPKGRV
ncbi:MAG: ATP-dependent ligase [Microbacteriaceae bacterium]|jgi:hypothetical protein|nr:ATP-dependent ligase [Microbacteriaceae bacterium]HEV7957276.1 ATP-dependent DNA ligase [Marisediminicola sp.]